MKLEIRGRRKRKWTPWKPVANVSHPTITRWHNCVTWILESDPEVEVVTLKFADTDLIQYREVKP